MDPQPNYLLIIRAADDDHDGAHAEVRLGFVDEPTEDEVDDTVGTVRLLFEVTFKREPERVGHAVLPWINANDGDDDD